MLLPHRLKIRQRLAGKHLPLAQSHPRPPHRAVSRPQVVRCRPRPVVGRASRPLVVRSRLQPVVDRVSRPQVVRSRLQLVVDRVSRPQVVRSRPRPVVGRASRPLVVRSRLQPVVDRVSRPPVVRSRLQLVVDRVSRPPVVRSRPRPVVDRVSRPQVVRCRLHPLVLVLPHHPPRSLKAFANPAIFDEMAGVLPSALGWLGSQLKAMEASIYFYRDTDQQEVGLLVESGDTLYPVGIKKTVSPWQNARRQFDVLDKLGKTIGLGAVLCLVERDLPLPQGVKAVPVGYL